MATQAIADPTHPWDALGRVVPRLTALIRTIPDPSVPALGVWNAGEVAVHVSHAWRVLTSLASGEASSPIHEVAELAGMTTTLVREEADRDLAHVADRIDAAAADFLAMAPAVPASELRPWIIEGITVPVHVLGCHLLNECLIHGYDIAAAGGRPWPIARADAATAITGFLFPTVARLGPREMVVQESARGLRARYDIRLRGGGGVVLAFDDGALTVEPQSSRRVDCHLLADPSALFLVMWGRVSQWPAVRRGHLLAWGRRPWLSWRLRALLRNP